MKRRSIDKECGKAKDHSLPPAKRAKGKGKNQRVKSNKREARQNPAIFVDSSSEDENSLPKAQQKKFSSAVFLGGCEIDTLSESSDDTTPTMSDSQCSTSDESQATYSSLKALMSTLRDS